MFLENTIPWERKTFGLEPLKYTPKYHLIVEIDENRSSGWIDTPQDQLTPDDREEANRKREFYGSLLEEDPDHKVKADIQ